MNFVDYFNILRNIVIFLTTIKYEILINFMQTSKSFFYFIFIFQNYLQLFRKKNIYICFYYDSTILKNFIRVEIVFIYSIIVILKYYIKYIFYFKFVMNIVFLEKDYLSVLTEQLTDDAEDDSAGNDAGDAGDSRTLMSKVCNEKHLLKKCIKKKLLIVKKTKINDDKVYKNFQNFFSKINIILMIVTILENNKKI
ncbi:hypothetical protein RFI_38475 [Reticulomyxa filosa]|uniref:Uncharacterized protein n=1 Tax=Reticulomyxa filosa TaxID=46433 RepID=X6LD13_RETFI|nr:hypothetical protein RFI_38475 [Reticulomyxa filosa]|eukprot:ETN99011.1 hypothetical protein RFI_38475 [Reticulomyxa filosa]